MQPLVPSNIFLIFAYSMFCLHQCKVPMCAILSNISIIFVHDAHHWPCWRITQAEKDTWKNLLLETSLWDKRYHGPYLLFKRCSNGWVDLPSHFAKCWNEKCQIQIKLEIDFGIIMNISKKNCELIIFRTSLLKRSVKV